MNRSPSRASQRCSRRIRASVSHWIIWWPDRSSDSAQDQAAVLATTLASPSLSAPGGTGCGCCPPGSVARDTRRPPWRPGCRPERRRCACCGCRGRITDCDGLVGSRSSGSYNRRIGIVRGCRSRAGCRRPDHPILFASSRARSSQRSKTPNAACTSLDDSLV